MSTEALLQLEAAHQNLVSALDVNEIAQIERGIEQLQDAIAAVRETDGWRDCPETRERARRIARLAEASRVRVNFLTDATAQRLQTLAEVRGHQTGGAYGRPGRQIA